MALSLKPLKLIQVLRGALAQVMSIPMPCLDPQVDTILPRPKRLCHDYVSLTFRSHRAVRSVREWQWAVAMWAPSARAKGPNRWSEASDAWIYGPEVGRHMRQRPMRRPKWPSESTMKTLQATLGIKGYLAHLASCS